MRRVVVTGLGIISPIGNNKDEVLASLKAGITFAKDYAECFSVNKTQRNAAIFSEIVDKISCQPLWGLGRVIK